MTASLYIHIPFCASGKCDYCDFYSIPIIADNNDNLMDSYIQALLDDTEDQLSRFEIDNIPTVYIGGGTPSAVGAGHITDLLSDLQKIYKKLEKYPSEITIEANPESADESF